MKASELIQVLGSYIEYYGDVEIRIGDHEMNDDGKLATRWLSGIETTYSEKFNKVFIHGYSNEI